MPIKKIGHKLHCNCQLSNGLLNGLMFSKGSLAFMNLCINERENQKPLRRKPAIAFQIIQQNGIVIKRMCLIPLRINGEAHRKHINQIKLPKKLKRFYRLPHIFSVCRPYHIDGDNAVQVFFNIGISAAVFGISRSIGTIIGI